MKNKPKDLSKVPYNSNKASKTEGNLECDETMIELKKVYWYEKQLLIAIPMLLRSATTFELVDSLTMLTKHTREHIKSLEKKFPNIGRLNILRKNKTV